jgi:hypothetical protein
MDDEEVMRRAEEIRQERQREYEAERAARYRARQDAQERLDRAFAAKTGITWEQYEAVEDYVRIRVYGEL